MRVTCLQCAAEIPADDVNVREGVAFCRQCQSLSRLSEMLDRAERDIPTGVDPDTPPPGCSIRDDGFETRLRASARSAGGIFGGLFMMLFWNGIVSVFVLIAAASTVQLIFGSLPAWFPAPNFGSNGMGVGMTIFLWVFLTPFITIGLILAGVFFTALLGRVDVRVRGREGLAVTGFGPFLWRRRFDAGAVTSVRIGQTSWKQNDQAKPVVVIEADRTIRVGSVLSEERRAWLAAALQRLLV